MFSEVQGGDLDFKFVMLQNHRVSGGRVMFFVVIHIVLVILLLILILLQPPNSDGMGGMGSPQMGTVFSVKSSSNILTKLTALVACSFVVSTLFLVAFFAKDAKKASIADRIIVEQDVNKPSELQSSVPFEN